MSLDQELILRLNAYVGRWPALDALVRLLVNDYFIPVSLILGLVFLWFGGRAGEERERWQRAGLLAVAAVALTNTIVKLNNLAYHRARPFEELTLDLLYYRPIDSGFPSNAAAFGFAVATSVWLWDRRAARAFFALALVWSATRIYAGIYYPSDILGGALIGTAAAVLARAVLRRAEPFVVGLVATMRRLGLA